eukprot:CAMPEP_0117664774 /NCGR_PEP_ID=MMETSP0804-20121206/9421_1 /TAXON_ID=1074897 /ORGANISM="Tetraselmis astigmatica, Strain CCMP880" /LENGTH=696 /DNA_ID=CAMNT_0005472073 /DNA_START=148 /DNA_END=2239 /DNA_ORIENTATION=-
MGSGQLRPAPKNIPVHGYAYQKSKASAPAASRAGRSAGSGCFVPSAAVSVAGGAAESPPAVVVRVTVSTASRAARGSGLHAASSLHGRDEILRSEYIEAVSLRTALTLRCDAAEESSRPVSRVRWTEALHGYKSKIQPSLGRRERTISMGEVVGRQTMTPNLPVELQDDLFTAISETGLYDFCPDNLNFAPTAVSGGLSHADMPGLGIHDQADRSTFTDHHHPGFSDPSMGHSNAIRMQSQHHQHGLETAQNRHAGHAETSTGGFYVEDQSMQDPMAARAINCAAEQAAEQAAKVAADTRTRLSEAAESSQGAAGTGMEVATPRSLDVSAQKRKVKATPGGSNENTPRSANKGLRHFSLKVCEKVQEKGRTTYNEVADELVVEFQKSGECGSPGAQYDEKNIRRRVYDALNVLMAMEIIQKEKKEISWKGLPCMGDPDQHTLLAKKNNLTQEIEQKQAYLQELVEQYQTLKLLMQRNEQKPLQGKLHGFLHLPFILIQTERDATVEVFISDDMQNVQMDFAKSPFQIHDDGYLLKQMMKSGQLGADERTGAGDGAAQAAGDTSMPPPPPPGSFAPSAGQAKTPEFPDSMPAPMEQYPSAGPSMNGQQQNGGNPADWHEMMALLQHQMTHGPNGQSSSVWDTSVQQVLGMIMSQAGKMGPNGAGPSNGGQLNTSQRDALATIATQLQVLQKQSGNDS